MERISYVALGDSIAAGGPTSFSYVDLVADGLRGETGVEVVLRNLAVNGAASDDLLRRLRGGRSYAQAISGADLLTVTIGGNDLIRALRASLWSGRRRDPMAFLAERVARYERNWAEILDRLVSLVPPDRAALRATNYYDPLPGNPVFGSFVNGPMGRRLGDLSRERNRRILQAAEERGFVCADVYTAFNGQEAGASPWERGLLAYDGFHPSEAGQRLIADTVHALGYAPLAVPQTR